LEKILVGTYHLMSIPHNPRKTHESMIFHPKSEADMDRAQKSSSMLERLFLPELFRIKSRTALGVV